MRWGRGCNNAIPRETCPTRGYNSTLAEKRLSEDNTGMNDEQPTTEEHPVDVPPVEAERSEVHPVERQALDPRRRLRELLAIPDRERSDALWDELIALEIQLAPGNRAQSPQADGGRRQEPGQRQDQGRRPEQQGRRPEQQARRQEPGPGKRPGKRFFKKPKRGPSGPSFQN